ncbi:glycolate oxidase FAD binding subunit [Sulfitobacter marinus]|uniref:Glycolate oxidase FAD binding subunit n=1 Tax=Sulfitobacter marinus TaxID=394264 RepID=A0A1I6V0J5_9RHOB|nr:FAD-binding protein [Sulfitobacter marinus]SFT07192.1 glycolate oxidase FAD binding subunit [Sulfitobacter marinus]
MDITSEQALVDAVKGADGPLAVRGGGTRGVPVRGAVMSVAGLSGISLYEPGAMTVVAKAGTPVVEIEAALAGENQRLAFEPMDHRALLGTKGTPTIGGAMAANVSGPRRISVGAARDFLLGVRYVDGTGAVIKNGGRVMKNVTGYDLVKLMAGSYGTLGVLSEVSLKVLPRPETHATLVLNGLDDAGAVAAMAQALGSPFEVTGAAHDPSRQETNLRVEGFEASVAYRLEKLRALLSATGAQIDVRDVAASDAIWADIRDVAAFHGKEGDVWRVSCKPSDGPAIAARSGAQTWFYDWAGGLIWLLTIPGHDLRQAVGAFDGHATLVRADAANKARLGMFHPEPAGLARLTSKLRAQFDPKGIFNAGLMDPAA